MTTNLEEGDLVLCTVDRIIGTNVFAKFSESGKEYEGVIVFSEIAPGRIRNIRDYVFPDKKIICKILRISASGDRVDLSFRRVTPKEQQEFKEREKQERSCESILKNVLGEKAESIIKEIKKEDSIYESLQEARNTPEGKRKLEKLAGKKETEKILEVLDNQKRKRIILKKEISLTTSEPNGIETIKNLLGKIENTEVRYISAGKYSLKKESEDIKKSDQELKNQLETLEKEAKKMNVQFALSSRQKDRK